MSSTSIIIRVILTFQDLIITIWRKVIIDIMKFKIVLKFELVKNLFCIQQCLLIATPGNLLIFNSEWLHQISLF